MARQKPPNTKTRVAREIAAMPGLDRKQKALALAAHHRSGANTAALRARQQDRLANRISNARDDARGADRSERIDNARASQQAQLRGRIAQARAGSPQPAPHSTARAIGREKTGTLGLYGRVAPIPSPRIDARKFSPGLGRGPIQGSGFPTYRK